MTTNTAIIIVLATLAILGWGLAGLMIAAWHKRSARHEHELGLAYEDGLEDGSDWDPAPEGTA